MRIIHINQAHKPALANPPQEIIDEIIRSQFQVGQELKKYTGYPILLESLHKDLSDASSFSLEMAKISLSAKILFPEGFPKNFSNLDPIQKNFLYDQGVVFTLFYLGEIPVLYKSIHGEVRNNIDQQISEGRYGQVFTPRELEAIECAKETAIKTFKTLDKATIIIVFGGGHNFKPYCDKEGFEYELINTIQRIPQDQEVQQFYPTTQPLQPSSKNQSILFTSDSTVNIPIGLKKALNDSGMLKECVTKGYVTMEKLIDAYQNNPWVIKALGCSNIYNGICNNNITVDQLLKLNEEQVISIKHKFKDEALQTKVEDYINQNHKRKRI
ncbi:MAG: hypothetical protein A3F12_01960 [Gammaproteobacteria bacterium RIFCSPHIGHO2_12_FULL_38_14]|nr:MAG: hypothetical protein A3F12_01960 [Gammaproteobacteria bacterium RIFCSPHIGHO2_12_FULL_38_14]